MNDADRRRSPDGFDDDAIFADIVAHLNDEASEAGPAEALSAEDAAAHHATDDQPTREADPTWPNDEADPTHPANRTSPTDPTGPTHDADPTRTADPTSPTDPTWPTHEADPTRTADPTSPTDPTWPTHDADPTWTADPIQPADPTWPIDPTRRDNEADRTQPTDSVEQAPGAPAPIGPVDDSGPQVWRAHQVPDEDGEHFEPPPVTPLPAGDLQFWAIIAGMTGGPLLLVYLVFFNRYASSVWILLAIGMSVGGFALLVSRMPGRQDDDDDGARL